MKHANLGASSSSRWLHCPASAKQVLKYKRTTSAAAEHGTACHELGEICLVQSQSPHKFIGKKLKDAPTVSIDKEMAKHVEGYVDYVRSFKGDLYVEERVDYSDWVKGGFGTSDAIVINDEVCHVIDLKMGMQEVSAIENTQAMLYGLGVLSDYGFAYDFERIVLHIYQPRISNFSEWEISRDDLLIWAEWVRDRALLCEDDNAPYNPSEKACHWCAHKANCVALFEHTQEVIGAEFDALDELPEPSGIDIELVLSNKKLIEGWLKAVEQNAFEMLSSGTPVKGFKLVEGRTTRKWHNECKAFNSLMELGTVEASDLEVTKFISVAQAEKLVGKANFLASCKDLVNKSDGKPTLAPESDKRKPFGNVSDCFDKM